MSQSEQPRCGPLYLRLLHWKLARAFGKRNAIVVASTQVVNTDFPNPYDRNGGSGTRYYPPECMRTHLIPRMLMYGGQVSASIDMPLGKFKAVRSEGANAALFEDNFSACGADNLVIANSILIEE